MLGMRKELKKKTLLLARLLALPCGGEGGICWLVLCWNKFSFMQESPAFLVFRGARGKKLEWRIDSFIIPSQGTNLPSTNDDELIRADSYPTTNSNSLIKPNTSHNPDYLYQKKLYQN